MIHLAKYQKMCQMKNIKTEPVSMHMVFTGNPGTGKTTVARLIGEIYNEIGLLSTSDCIEVDRSILVAEYVGQTAIKTKNMINRALGGVLYIDEAYTLVNKGAKDFGQEAIDTLLKEMEDHREKKRSFYGKNISDRKLFLPAALSGGAGPSGRYGKVCGGKGVGRLYLYHYYCRYTSGGGG